MRKKIALIGAGQIGGTMALLCLQRELGDIVLFDIAEGTAKGKALDLMQAAAVSGSSTSVIGTNDYKDIEGADICIITAGIPRKPGMSRDDLVETNTKIIGTVATNIKDYAPKSTIIAITNPLDAMVYALQKLTGFPKQRLIGMAGVLDTARFRTFLSMETGIAVRDINAFVLGGHGDTMVPLTRYSSIAGIPLCDYPGLSADKIEQIVDRTRKGGGEIVQLLGNGSAFYAPAYSAIDMAESILKDQKRLLPGAALCEGEYKQEGIFMGVPIVLGKNGIEKIIDIPLTQDEQKELDLSGAAVRSLMESVDKIL